MPFDLTTIGQLLKTAREERGLTIEDVARALFIRKAVIGAIELGDWQNLPHTVYVKGYVNQYAAHLNVTDAVEAALAAEQEAVTVPEDEALPAVKPEERPAKRWEPASWKLHKKVAVVGSMAAIVIAFIVFQNLDRSPRHVPGPNQAETVSQMQAVSQVQAANQVQTVSDAYRGAAPANGVQGEKRALETKKLMIACQERTWVRIMIDDTEKKEFMMNPEEVVMLNAQNGFDLLVGNAGGVKLFYNGKDIGFTGETGEVKRVNLS